MGITAAASLRDRKRRETRDRIVSAARSLFAEHGFAAVTVARIGTAAGVSAKTVFNYFPVKEGLFFAGDPPADERLPRLVARRPAGESAYQAVRRYAVEGTDAPAGLVRAVRERLPGESVYEAIERFRAAPEPPAGPHPDVVAARARAYLASPELTTYARDRFAGQEVELADVLTADTGAPADDPLPPVAAAALIAPLRWAFTNAQQLLADGTAPAEVAARRAAGLARAYELLGADLAGYARRPAGTP
jgi:AcrR family transcriptional regulator